MNIERAREILVLYRPGTDDPQDTDFSEALELARQDAELARWLENHRKNQEIIRNRLKQIAVPAGFKEQILAERNCANDNDATKVISPAHSFWRRPVFAMAAAIILLLSLSLFWFPQRDKENYSSYRNRMISTAQQVYRMDLETNDLNEIHSFLAKKLSPANYTLPKNLEKMQCVGCVVLRWQNKPVSMICFRTGRPLVPGEKSDLFLFVADRPASTNSSASPGLEKINDIMTASWLQDDKSYLLVTKGNEDFIQKFL